MTKAINIYQPSLGAEELASVASVFESNWIGRGSKTSEFETSFAESCGLSPESFVTTTSCTEALFQILSYLRLAEDDQIIIPSISFIGAYNAIIASGAQPVLCDVDPYSLNPNLEHILEKVTEKTRAMLLIHYGGIPIRDMSLIIDFCDSNDIILIEDNACSPFSEICGVRTGTLGAFGAWSFDAMKILCCGDGSIIYGKSIDDVNNLRRRLYMGLTSRSGFSSDAESEWWAFDIDEPTSRQIMNDITASIALAQLKKIPLFLSRRKEIAEFYDAHLNIEHKSNHFASKQSKSSYYMYWITLESREFRNRIASALKHNGVYTTFRYYPLHRVTGIINRGLEIDPGSLVGSDFAADRTLCIPLHQSLSDDDILKVASLINQYSY